MLREFCSNTATSACVVDWTFIQSSLSWFGITLGIMVVVSILLTIVERRKLGALRLSRERLKDKLFGQRVYARLGWVRHALHRFPCFTMS